MNHTKSVALYILYSNTVGLAAAGRLIKKRIKHNKTLDQTIKKNIFKSVCLNTDKHQLRMEARYNQLVRGFLRGKKYHSIENNCSPDNKPYAEAISIRLKELLYEYEFNKLVGSTKNIEKWLKGEE